MHFSCLGQYLDLSSNPSIIDLMLRTSAPVTIAPTSRAPSVKPVTMVPTPAPSASPVTIVPTSGAPSVKSVTMVPTTRAPSASSVTIVPTSGAPSVKLVTMVPTTRAPSAKPVSGSITIPTLNYNGMTRYMLDLSTCACCGATTTKQASDAFCVLGTLHLPIQSRCISQIIFVLRHLFGLVFVNKV
jgi:hypothetical protein